MRLTTEQTKQNRSQILETASKLFRTRGIGNVSVADVMKESGFTHGGFYNHFESKEQLALEVIACSFENAAKYLSDRIVGAPEPKTALKAAMVDYLSEAHRDSCEGGCPASALPVDAARNTKDVQTAYADGIESYLDIFAAQMDGDKKKGRQEALGLLSSIVGAMVLSRAVKEGNPKLSDELLSSARKRFRK